MSQSTIIEEESQQPGTICNVEVFQMANGKEAESKQQSGPILVS